MSRTRQPVVGVGAVAVRDGAVLLIRRGKQPYLGHWTLPGGSVIWGEPLKESLKREMLEETGLEVKVGELAGHLEAIDAKGDHHFVILDYHIEVLGGDLVAGDDASEARWVPLAEVSTLQTTPRLIEALKDYGVI